MITKMISWLYQIIEFKHLITLCIISVIVSVSLYTPYIKKHKWYKWVKMDLLLLLKLTMGLMVIWGIKMADNNILITNEFWTILGLISISLVVSVQLMIKDYH